MELWNFVVRTLFPERETQKRVREADVDALRLLIHPTQTPLGSIEGTVLLSYKDPLVHASIVETKFYDNKKAAALLGAALHEYLLEASTEGLPIVLIPLPLSTKRMRERGYNQVERVCTEAIKDLPNVSIDTALLVRTKHTAPQTSLKRKERFQNMKDAFTRTAPLLDGHLYILVDDVMTTGATLTAAAHVFPTTTLQVLALSR